MSAAAWVGGRAALALGDGRVRFLAKDGAGASVAAHDGAVLCAAPHPDGRSLVTGGDDGRLRRVALDGTVEDLLEPGRRWVHAVAATPVSGTIAAAVGREVVVLRPGRPPTRLALPQAAGGLAFDPKGRRLAVARYGGVGLYWALLDQPPEQLLRWKGSHVEVVWSPDGKYVLSAMQENMLHGWRIADRAELRMEGYPAKTRSLSWSARRRWLLTSGASAVVAWPFTGRNGPMGKAPLELGPATRLVTRVAGHPGQEVLAAGYEDGAVRLIRLSDAASSPVAHADGTVTALAWSPAGDALAWGTEGGSVGVFAPVPAAA